MTSYVFVQLLDPSSVSRTIGSWLEIKCKNTFSGVKPENETPKKDFDRDEIDNEIIIIPSSVLK